jgi:hypothetical protein
VRSLTVTGLASEPVVTEVDGVIGIKTDGLTAEFRGAAVQRDGETLTVRLSATR